MVPERAPTSTAGLGHAEQSPRRRNVMADRTDAPGSDIAAQTVQKLEQFYTSLSGEEQQVIAEMVRASLIHEADRSEADVSGYALPKFFQGVTGKNAPTLVR